jgi:sugar lactone lactonase YvrE
MMKRVADPVLIRRGLRFAEGINFDRTGTLYCVDLEGGGVWRMPCRHALQGWVQTGGKPNGSRFGPDGDFCVTEGTSGSIYRFDVGTREQRPFMRPW